MENDISQVCSECVADFYLKKLINLEPNNGQCTYCVNVDKPVMSLDELADMVSRIFKEHFQEGRDIPIISDTSDNVHYEQDGESPEFIVADMVGIDEDSAILIDLFEIIHETAAYEIPSGGHWLFESTSNYETEPISSVQHRALWISYCRIIKHETRFFSVQVLEILDKLFSGIETYKSFHNIPLIRKFNSDGKMKVYRARKANSETARIKICLDPQAELNAPPNSSAKVGRMNPAGISAFYSGLDRMSCINELRLSVGEVAVSGSFSITKPIIVLDLTMISSIYQELSMFDPDYETKISHLKFLHDFGDELSKPVLQQASELEYLPTQAFAEYISTRFKTRIDAVLYQSAQDPDHRNLVILPPVIALDLTESKLHEQDQGEWEEFWLEGYSIMSMDWDELDGGEHSILSEECEATPTLLRFNERSLEVHRVGKRTTNYSTDAVFISDYTKSGEPF